MEVNKTDVISITLTNGKATYKLGDQRPLEGKTITGIQYTNVSSESGESPSSLGSSGYLRLKRQGKNEVELNFPIAHINAMANERFYTFKGRKIDWPKSELFFPPNVASALVTGESVSLIIAYEG